jgi:chromosome condensin MukBEF ATPase and DNA-binding subunit MukB
LLVNVEMSSIEREIGNLEARMQTVESELHALRSDVREIRDALVGVKGGWRTLTLMIGLASTAGAVVGHYMPTLFGLKP